MQLEHAAVCGRRAVERDLLLHALLGCGELLVVRSGHDEQRARDLERRAVAARGLQAALDRGHGHFLHVALGREAVDDDAVGDLARDLRHHLADRGEEHLGRAVRIRRRREERRHQRVAVELAFEFEGRLVVPRRPDRLQREDVLAHAAGRVRPRHREALLDVRLDLRPEAEDEPAVRRLLQVVGGVGEHHRRAREGDRDAGGELDALGVLGRDRERQERVVAGLRREQPVVPDRLELAARGPISVSDGAMIPVSTFIGFHASVRGRQLAVQRTRGARSAAWRPAAEPSWCQVNRRAMAGEAPPAPSGSPRRPTARPPDPAKRVRPGRGRPLGTA